jgi:uncharacterized membrane protein
MILRKNHELQVIMLKKWKLAQFKKSRVETLVDGIFAIAMTLLVFSVRQPDPLKTYSDDELIKILLNMWPNLLASFLSFVALGVFWILHHLIYNIIRRSDKILLWLNIFFLMGVAFMPFTTSLFSENFENRITIILFTTNLIIIGIALYAIWGYVVTKPGYIDEKLDANAKQHIVKRIITVPTLAALSMLVSTWSHLIAAVLLLSILPLALFPTSIDDHFSDAEFD